MRVLPFLSPEIGDKGKIPALKIQVLAGAAGIVYEGLLCRVVVSQSEGFHLRLEPIK